MKCLRRSGKVIRKIKTSAKKKFKFALTHMAEDYAAGAIDYENVRQRLNSYLGHLQHGHTYHLRGKLLAGFVLRRICERSEMSDR
jgi:hypothetical protein